MAQTYKHVFQFIQNNGAQWSEIYYRNGGSQISAELLPQPFFDDRLAMLMDIHTLQYVRISAVGIPRLTILNTINQVGKIPTGNVAGKFLPAAPGDACVIAMTGANGGSRKLWLRGGAEVDSGLDANGRPFTTPANALKIATWVNTLATNNFGIVTRYGVVSNPPYVVSQAAPDTAPGQTVLTVVIPGAPLPPFAPQPGSQVILGKFSKKDLPSLNGIFTVVKATAPTVTVNYRMPPGGAQMGLTGSIRAFNLNQVSVFAPAQCKFAYSGVRVTKSPFSRSRGSRRAARIRLAP